jgi:hypothetical protein
VFAHLRTLFLVENRLNACLDRRPKAPLRNQKLRPNPTDLLTPHFRSGTQLSRKPTERVIHYPPESRLTFPTSLTRSRATATSLTNRQPPTADRRPPTAREARRCRSTKSPPPSRPAPRLEVRENPAEPGSPTSGTPAVQSAECRVQTTRPSPRSESSFRRSLRDIRAVTIQSPEFLLNETRLDLATKRGVAQLFPDSINHLTQPIPSSLCRAASSRRPSGEDRSFSGRSSTS